MLECPWILNSLAIASKNDRLVTILTPVLCSTGPILTPSICTHGTHSCFCPYSFGMEPETAASQPSPPEAKPVPKQWADKKDFVFDVSKFLEKERDLDFKDLKIDEDQNQGQVRGLDMKHVEKLYEDFKMNPPVKLMLTVWRNPSMLLVIASMFVCFSSLYSRGKVLRS